MKIRKYSTVVGILIIIVGIGTCNILKNAKAPQPRNHTIVTIPVVDVINVNLAKLPIKIKISGRVEAFEKIEVFSEVNGKLLNSAKSFKEGISYTKGEMLLHIDDAELKASLSAQRGDFQNLILQSLPDIKLDYPVQLNKWEKYMSNISSEKLLPKLPNFENSKEENYIVSKGILSKYYNIKSQEARLEKYSIIAPFSGSVIESSITPGTMIRAGQKLGVYINPGSLELEAAVNITDIKYLSYGQKVVLISSEVPGKWNGTIARINNYIDPATQNVSVYISLDGKGLKEGMYLSGNIIASEIDNAFVMPRNWIINGEKVFAVKDSVLEKITITVVKVSEDSAYISQFPKGYKLLKGHIPGAYEGMIVQPNEI